MVRYGVSQLHGQLTIVTHARLVESVLSDTTVNDSLKARLKFIQEVRQFAIDSLGLKDSKNYTSLYDQQGKPLLLVLTASEPFQIKAYEWHFPFLGNVPYKGFFNFPNGRKEEAELKKKGLDTDLGPVSAWSTLGWFKDPILSGMLKRSDGQLAELIIHELTHSTIYIKDRVDFNENLASFIGEQGAIRFLRSHYGGDTTLLVDYRDRLTDYNLFSKQMIHAASYLDSVYSAILGKSIAEKLRTKEVAMDAITHSVDTISFHNPQRYKDLFKTRTPNNAYFLNYIRYDSQKDSLKQVYETNYHSDLKFFLSELKK